MASLRYHVTPRDAPAAVAARVLGLTEAQFAEKLPQLLARGFPKPDETTGLYDLDAIGEWRRRRHPQVDAYLERLGMELFLTAFEQARDAGAVFSERLRRLKR
jgi:hypothetical protein